MFVLPNSMAQALGGEELRRRGHSNACNPQVTTHHTTSWFGDKSILLNNDVQIEAFLVRIVAQIGRGSLPGEIGFVALGKGENHLHSPTGG